MKSPLIVGYKGEIGSYLLNELLRYLPKAVNILCFDINESRAERLERIRKADVIFLCVPIEEIVPFFNEWKDELTCKVIVEQSSLKSYVFHNKRYPKKILQQNATQVLSMHVLFRPSATPNRKDHSIAITGRLLSWQTAKVHSFLCSLTSNITMFADYKEHDKAMAFQQTVMHRVIISLEELMDCYHGDTFICKRVRELAIRIGEMDSKLFKIIQRNEYVEQPMNLFLKKVRVRKNKKH